MVIRRFIQCWRVVVGCALGLVVSVSTADAQRRGMMLNSLAPAGEVVANVRELAEAGADLVRFPIYLSYQPSVTAWLPAIDAVVAEAERYSMVVVVDLHHPTPFLHSSTIVDPNFFVNTWSTIASHLRGRGRLWFDLANEPDHPNWPAIALRAARAIRAVDPDSRNHRIVYANRGTTTRGSSTIEALQGIDGQIIAFHFYDFADLQFYPNASQSAYLPYPSPGRTKADIRARLERVRDAGRRLNLPVYIGEVAISQAHPNAPAFLRDFTQIARELGLHLSVHAFREADLWNYELNPRAWEQLRAFFRQ